MERRRGRDRVVGEKAVLDGGITLPIVVRNGSKGLA